MSVAAKLKEICEELEIHLIFKSSFDKANRSSVKAPRGLGMEHGLQILQRVKTELNLPIVTDVHETWQCAPVRRSSRHAANSGISIPSDRLVSSRCQNRKNCQCKERDNLWAPLGHEKMLSTSWLTPRNENILSLRARAPVLVTTTLL